MPSFFLVGGFKVKSWRIVVVLLLCLVLVGLTACGGGGGSEVQHQRIEVTRGDIVLSVTAEGNLSLPWHQGLTFGTSGTIIEINVNEGDSVVKGQILASLDTISLEQGVKTAEQGVKTEELDIKTAEMDLESAENSLAQLTAPYPFLTFAFVLPEALEDVRVAEYKIKVARDELVLGLKGEPYDMATMKDSLRQAQELLAEAESKMAVGLGQGIVPSETYWTMRAAQIVVDKAQIVVDRAKNDLDTANTALDTAHNDLDTANNDFEKAVILAPFGGVISTLNVEEGDKLSSASYATTTIIEIIDPTIIRLKAKLDEIDIPSVGLNQRVVIEVDALPELQLEGEVTYINPVSIEESDIVLYEVTIGFDVPHGFGLKSGMSAWAEFVVDERNNILLVPNRAIKNDDEGYPVVEIMVDEQIQEQSVAVGISDGYQTEIVAGLHEGELVVIETSVKPESSGGFFFGD